MRNRNFLPIFLLALALAAPAAMADLHPGGVAFDEKDDKDKGKSKDRKGKDGDRGRRGAQGIPPGHLPPPGECRVWYDGEPPGQQPPPTDCSTARREAARNGGRVVYGDDRREDRWDDDDRWEDDDRRDDCDRWDDCEDWDDRWDERWLRGFDGFDRNDDGYLSRSEWTAGGRVFELLDVNEDGRLGRNEIRDARPRDGNRENRQERLEDRFRNSDDNRDGRLSRNEWWGREDTFERLDRNNDGYLSWAEIWGRRGSSR